jgi:S1-C subfamily serine protease
MFPKKNFLLSGLLLTLAVFLVAGFGAGSMTAALFPELQDYFQRLKNELFLPLPSASPLAWPEVKEYVAQTTQEQAVIKVVKETTAAVVSIIITKDLPVFEQYYVSPFKDFFNDPFFELQVPQYRQKGTQKQEIGGGSGFIISEDGLVLTNKHVVLDIEAEYTVLTNDGQKYPAKVLAKDPSQDLAILKIEKEKVINQQGGLQAGTFPVVKLGDSDKLEIGQTVVAIGNALGEFRNTVSVGVVSGLGRTITASGNGNFVETLQDVIQTDAAINKGNSGGPLLNLRGEVIGINTATVSGAQSIGFAIPVNVAKKDIRQVKAVGKITYPFLGVRYVLINEKIQSENKLAVNYGAWVVRNSDKPGETAIFPDSPADKAGLKEGDIILEFNNEKITIENTLAKIISKYSPGEAVSLKILSSGQEKTVSLVLGERSQ